jgi:hypothetical protein
MTRERGSNETDGEKRLTRRETCPHWHFGEMYDFIFRIFRTPFLVVEWLFWVIYVEQQAGWFSAQQNRPES